MLPSPPCGSRFHSLCNYDCVSFSPQPPEQRETDESEPTHDKEILVFDIPVHDSERAGLGKAGQAAASFKPSVYDLFFLLLFDSIDITQ